MAKRRKRLPTIGLGELREMHEDVKARKPICGSEEYSLLCAIGSCMGNWPRVKRRKAEELRKRYGALMKSLDLRNEESLLGG